MYVTLRSVPKQSEPKRSGDLASGIERQRRRIPSAVLAFGVVSMLTDVSSESVAAVLPLYITAVLGMGPLAYGFIDGIYQRAYLRPSGFLADGGRTDKTAQTGGLRRIRSVGNVASGPALGDRFLQHRRFDRCRSSRQGSRQGPGRDAC